MKVVVLMSTYNGEEFLREQIESVLAQDIRTISQLQLVVRDDGSSDHTVDILEEYQRNKKLIWYSSENLGPEKSFWTLLQNAPDADFYAFCDQDDYWFPNKLSRAVERLTREEADKPLLYCSGYIVTDSKLQPLEIKRSPLQRYTDYAHSLIYSTAPGCTYVFNKMAREIACRYKMEDNYVMMHDWLIHKIVTVMDGIMVYDDAPSIYYRQHSSNVIGVRSYGWQDFVLRVQRFLVGTGRQTRSNCAKSLLAVYGEYVSQSVYTALDLVANYRGSFCKKIAFMRDRRFYTETIDDLFLAFLIFMECV